jgi:hypothetical protein
MIRVEVDNNLSLCTDLKNTTTAQNNIERLLKTKVESFGSNCNTVIGDVLDPEAEEIAQYARKVKRVWEPDGLSNQLMQTIHTCYADHYPLTLSPDNVWIAIAQGFANHINQNAEALRDKFVNFSGKKEIIIYRNTFIKGDSNNDWQGCFPEFSDGIAEFIGDKRDLIVSKFSTTGPLEKAISEIVLMDSMQSYFHYTCRTLCGIPSVILTGTPEDWADIFLRTQKLAQFDLSWWTDSLLPVLGKIVETAAGENENIDFWKEIYKVHGGSGGPYISGWINTFFPYLCHWNKFYQNKGFDKTSRSYGPTMDQFPSGLSKLPFKWEYFNTTFEMEFIGGFIGSYQDVNDLSLTPALGWAVRDKVKE